jgi:hypothetical protein
MHTYQTKISPSWCNGALKVMYDSVGLGYAELRNALREAHRNRKRWRWSKSIHKGLLEACVGFTRHGSRVVKATVLARLRVAFKELGIINRRSRVLLDGEIKALEMQVRFRKRNLFRWVPQLRAWLRDREYKFWLGTMQTSRNGDADLVVEVEPP